MNTVNTPPDPELFFFAARCANCWAPRQLAPCPLGGSLRQVALIAGTLRMYVLENYDIAFSRDPADPAAPEVALLVVERSDLPPMEGTPHKAVLLAGRPEQGNEALRQLSLHFLDRAGPPRRPSEASTQVIMDLPLAVYDLLVPFTRLWICEVDQGQVVSEHELQLYKQDA